MKQAKTPDRQKTSIRKLPIFMVALCAIAVFAGSLCLFSALWYSSVYGQTGFDSILFTLQSSIDGVQSSLMISFLTGAFLPALCISTGVNFFLLCPPEKRRNIKLGKSYVLQLPLLKRGLIVGMSLFICLCMICIAGCNVGLFDYIADRLTVSELFEHYYKDPDTVAITFPEEKRNLVYIMLESMETSYLSEDLGGAMEYNLIPELYDIAANHINFSHNKGVGGFRETSGASWTIGSIVAQTAGIPLKTPDDVDDWQNGYGKNGVFLPGATTLTNILDEAGYYTTFMCGSDANFGGRKTYFMTHGMDHVYDIYTARKDGIVPKNYFEWWGMEDLYLFEYAKQELTEISRKDQPFAFTMLTVDTHHVGGYQCIYCTGEYEETYEQSISCSSRQVLEFLSWLQEQPFYENTTVVITGDHCSMDRGYFDRNVADNYGRRVYNVILNAAAEPFRTKNRTYCAMDLFPTTLAAMGCQIDGECLGLGTNLFSDVPTLSEKLGFTAFNSELSKTSDYYAAQFYEITSE